MARTTTARPSPIDVVRPAANASTESGSKPDAAPSWCSITHALWNPASCACRSIVASSVAPGGPEALTLGIWMATGIRGTEEGLRQAAEREAGRVGRGPCVRRPCVRRGVAPSVLARGALKHDPLELGEAVAAEPQHGLEALTAELACVECPAQFIEARALFLEDLIA